ncbi:MAG: hypothetical protein H6556_13640 [Lewinellaceae bacterium]|nr:hypothetical protein [Lewinellaceae bacterium]
MDIRSWKSFLARRYCLDIKYQGEEYKFSPVLEVSAGTALLYLETAPCYPLLIHFPRQCNSAGWMASILILNIFHNDYYEYTVDYLESLKLKRGEKVTLYGATAEFESIQSFNGQKHVCVFFKTKGLKTKTLIPLKNSLALMRTNKTGLNTNSYYDKVKNKTNSNKSLIEKTLDIDLAGNRLVFKSKVLIISGPGKRNSLSRFFHNTMFSDRSLSEICGYGKNLILEKNLGRLAKSIKQLEAHETTERKLVQLIMNIADSAPPENQALTTLISELREKIELFSLTDGRLLRLLDDIRKIDVVNEKKWAKVISKINKLEEKKGNSELFKNLKAVIIADVQMAFESAETLKKLLENGIGVIVLSDNSFISSLAYDRFENFRVKFPDCYRFIWDREKIAPLQTRNTRLVDKDFWLSCRIYQQQKIRVIVHDEPLIDEAHKILEGGRLFYQLEAFENLQASFREHLRPALFALKNSVGLYNNELEIAEQYFWKFLQEYGKYANKLPEAISEEINKGVDLLDQQIQKMKVKEYSSKENTLNRSRGHLLAEKRYHEENIRSEAVTRQVNIIRKLKGFRSRVIFPGFPQYEYSGRDLIRAVAGYFTPEVVLLSTPWESRVTRSYLEKHLNTGPGNDNLPKNELWTLTLQENAKMKPWLNIEEEMQAVPNESSETDEPESIDLEELWQNISESSTNSFVSKGNLTGTDYMVDAYTLNFPGFFVLMLKSSKVLTLNEDEKEITVEECPVRTLGRGDRVVFWENEKETVDGVLNSMPAQHRTFRTMNSWREALLNIFSKHGDNLEAVESHLNKVEQARGLNANLNRANLLRWKNDEDLIAPRSRNIRLILAGDSSLPEEKIEKKLEEIQQAKKQFLEFKAGLQKKLISVIQRELKKIGEQSVIDIEFIGVGKFQAKLRILELLNISYKTSKVRYQDTRKLIQSKI